MRPRATAKATSHTALPTRSRVAAPAGAGAAGAAGREGAPGVEQAGGGASAARRWRSAGATTWITTVAATAHTARAEPTQGWAKSASRWTARRAATAKTGT